MELNKIQPNASVRYTGLILTSLIFLSGSLFAQNDKKMEDAEIYGAIGMMFAEGSGLAKMEFTSEQIDLILAGMKKGIALGKMPPETEALMPKVQQIMSEKMKIARNAEQEGMKGIAAENKAKSKEYLALLATDEKVKKDPSGFYYEILRKGKGPSPT
ncbi:MAG: FKBP-type peptidyl-prolyl cis-trans isomerase N-terminal domain-containing protein, partial [Opitutales bacterium]|nr:FKBP-type peptidyl-prolyl cis-trans isomerase N-terminal domain-containing protein [Opitutales bacterium]